MIRANNWTENHTMQIAPVTWHSILDALRHYRSDLGVPSAENPSFSQPALLPENPADITGDRLYISALADSADLRRRGAPPFFALCLSDGADTSRWQRDWLSQTLVIREKISLAALFNETQAFFFRIAAWTAALQLSLIQNQSAQNLIDLSEDILGNYLCLTDSSMALLAYSKNIAPNDDFAEEFIRRGYRTEESFRLMKKHNAFTALEQNSAVVFTPAELPFMSHPIVSRFFKFRDTFFAHAHLLMLCNHRPPTPGLLDLYGVLISILNLYFENERRQNSSGSHIYDSLLLDLIENNVQSRETIRERAGRVAIPFSGLFDLYKITPRESVLVGRVLLDIARDMPAARCVPYRREIVVLNFYKEQNRESLHQNLSRLRAVCAKHDSVCGVSTPFATLAGMGAAYREASLALDYGRRLAGAAFPPTGREAEKEGVFCFADYTLYYLLETGIANREARQLAGGSLWAEIIRTLAEDDEKHGSFTLRLLHAYLANERKASATGKQLNMHRNNVIYHIRKIEERFAIDLNDQYVRLGLLTAYLLLDLQAGEDAPLG
ncbi:MAG: helix-turn-helix domain-containing protein [Gracilibacteraceae bacterium]|jgi:hypothetical protein|nr:helix-turn-helix domain-containing protein [Gracilibacteraceae bacterium]